MLDIWEKDAVKNVSYLKTGRNPLKSCVQTVTLYDFAFFYQGFLSQAFTNHRTAGEGDGFFSNSTLSLPPASETLKY